MRRSDAPSRPPLARLLPLRPLLRHALCRLKPWRNVTEPHVPRHPLSVALKELLRRVHRVTPRRAWVCVAEELLEPRLRDPR